MTHSLSQKAGPDRDLSELMASPVAQPRLLRTPEDLSSAMGIPFSDEQLAAVTAPLTPGVIIAGAGSGKTTVMAARVVWLVGTGQILPEQVLGLTFTRKAAGELAARVRSALTRTGVLNRTGEDLDGVEVVMTYDAFAARLVAEQGMRIGVGSDPTMLGGAARYRLASRVVNAAPGPFVSLSRLRPASVTERVLQLDAEMSSHLVGRTAIERQTESFLQELALAPLNNRRDVYASVREAEAAARERLELLELVVRYQALKRELGLMEFADQMAVAAELANRVPGVGAALRHQFRVVLLDEYQDTSSAQAELLRGLFSGPDAAHGRGHPVTAVGDPFQAIYGWRGAAASSILQFARQFPTVSGEPCAAWTLTINRRSGQRILDVANEIAISLRADPALASASSQHLLRAPVEKAGGSVGCASFETWGEEVNWLADDIAARERLLPWREIAVLMRRNADIGPVYAALRARDVPTEIVGLGGLLRLPEIADVVDTLRLLDDATANAGLARLLAGPRWRIGVRDLAALGRRARELAGQRPAERETLDADLDAAVAGVDAADIPCLVDTLDDLDAVSGLSEAARERLATFAAELAGLRHDADEPVLDLTRRVIATLGLDLELASAPDALSSNRPSQLGAFLDAISDYLDIDGDASLSGLLAYLDAELDYGAGLDQAVPSDRESVKLLTMHKAKGLEWDVVYLPSLVQGVFPSDRVTGNWVRSAAVLPSPLRGDADALPHPQRCGHKEFTAYADALKVSQLAAEDRLAYVAVTRARKELIGTGHSWRAGQVNARVPASYFGVIRAEAASQGRVETEAPPTAAVNPHADAMGDVPWPVPLDPEATARRRQAAERVGVARERIRTRQPLEEPPLPPELQAQVGLWDLEIDHFLNEARTRADRRRVAMPDALSVTQLMTAASEPDRFALDLLRPMPKPVGGAAGLGSRFHDWLRDRFERPPELVEDAQPSVSVSDPELRRLIDAFERGPYADRTPLAVELPFVLTLGDCLVRGRIDAVYADAGGVQVVDWKTSGRPADPLQLAIYRLAWAEAAGVDPDTVDAVFVHIQAARVDRPGKLPGRRELLQLVSGNLGE